MKRGEGDERSEGEVGRGSGYGNRRQRKGRSLEGEAKRRRGKEGGIKFEKGISRSEKMKWRERNGCEEKTSRKTRTKMKKKNLKEEEDEEEVEEEKGETKNLKGMWIPSRE
jgi:hypothetical protein